VIYPVLEWLLSKIPDLKKRAYLAKYLVKVDLPPEVAADPDVSEIFDQYEVLIDEFKNAHKELEAVKNSGYSTAELRKDIEEMEKEKDIVEKRIERMQRKVEGAPNVEAMMEAVKQLRAEKEKQRELQNQRTEQRAAIQHADQRITRMEQQLKDLRAAAVGATPEALLQKIEEETKVNTYIVMQKLPKELDAKRKMVDNLQKVIDQPALGQDDIAQLKEKIKSTRNEIEELTNKRNVSNDPMEDKLTLFRQQAAIIGRKKEATAEKLNDVRNELSALDEELAEKRQQVQSFAGETVLKGDDFKRYVASLRGKSNTYKKKRAELSEHRAEYGVLSRTLEIIQSKQERMLQSLSAFEAEKGISGYRDTKSNLAAVDATSVGLDAQKGKTLEEMSALVHQLTMKIGERKTRLAPIIKELRPLRQQCQDKEAEYDDRKHQYDALSLQLESSMSRVEQEVKKFQEEILANETKFHLLELRNRNLELMQQRAHDEIKLYVSNKPEDKKRSVREQLLKQVTN
jgi:intraflagellar transport protein 81